MLNWLSINKLFRSISLPQPNRWQTVCVCVCVYRWGGMWVGVSRDVVSEIYLQLARHSLPTAFWVCMLIPPHLLCTHTRARARSCHWLKSKCECNCLNSINSMPRCSPCFGSLLSARQTGQRLHLLAGDSQMNCCMLWWDFPIQRVCDKCVLLTSHFTKEE